MEDRGRKTILIVDDDVKLLLGLQKRLVHAGYDVLTATTGEEALALIADFRIDAMTLDVGLPGTMNGLGIAKMVKHQSSENRIPVIFITGEADQGFKEKCAEVGGRCFIAKPYDSDVLLRILDQLFAKDDLAVVARLSTAKRRQPVMGNPYGRIASTDC